jgi:hypothetical protein
MKTELRLADHKLLEGHQIVEIWYDGEFIGEVAGADGPGVRVISKHGLVTLDRSGAWLQVTEVRIGL